MAAVYEKLCIPSEVNILELQNGKTGELVGVFNETGKKSEAAPTAPCGLGHPTTTLPTCCPRYPPGSTVLECRLEGDQPVAHVVQVAADRYTTGQNMCLLVETKQSPSGPLSRVISRPQEDPKSPLPPCQAPPRVSSQLPMAYCLESCECPEGPVAVASKAPIRDCSAGYKNVITSLETTKGEERPDGPSSRVLYGPAVGEIVEASSCDENPRNLPVTFIDCTASPKGTSARITECSNDTKPGTKSYFETCVSRDGARPTVTGFQCPSENSNSCQHGVLETRVDEGGPRTCLISFPQDSKKYCSYMESKSSCSGPSARIRQRLVDGVCEEVSRTKVQHHRSPSNCAESCPGSKEQRRLVDCRVPKVERRNGLDPSDNVKPSPFRKGPKRQVCPPRCCRLIDRPRSENMCPFGHSQQLRGVKPPKSALVRQANLKESEEKRSEDAIVTSEDRSKMEMSKIGNCDSERCRKEILKLFGRLEPEVRSEELLTRYREYVSPNQLIRYETCRSKRNGLQDECSLPVPRSVIELKRKDLFCQGDNEDKSDEGKLDQNDIDSSSDRKPMKPHTKEVLFQERHKKYMKPKSEKSDSKVLKTPATRPKKSRLKKSKSRELYAGVVYTDCDCYHRNGLQHDCPRKSCGGPPCRVKPWPECELATYFMCKWQNYNDLLDKLPPTSFCGSREAWQEILHKEEQKSKERFQDQTPRKTVSCMNPEQEKDTVSEISDIPHGLVKEYAMIPIKVNSKAE